VICCCLFGSSLCSLLRKNAELFISFGLPLFVVCVHLDLVAVDPCRVRIGLMQRHFVFLLVVFGGATNCRFRIVALDPPPLTFPLSSLDCVESFFSGGRTRGCFTFPFPLTLFHPLHPWRGPHDATGQSASSSFLKLNSNRCP